MVLLYCKNNSLLSLHQYMEAKDVHRMVKELEPIEREAHLQEHLRNMEKMRKKLAREQDRESTRAKEYNTDLEWVGIRERNRIKDTQEKRIVFMQREMKHAQHMDVYKGAEMAIKPTARLVRRPGAQATASAFRGQQLLDAVRGKSKNAAVFVAPLCPIVNFDKPELDQYPLPT